MIWGFVAPPEVTNLAVQVEEFGQSRPGCRIRFFFNVNPYFQNDVVAKEFVRGPSGGFWGKGRGEPPLPTAQGRVWGLQSDPPHVSSLLPGHLVSHSTPIRWWQGQDPRSHPHKGPPAPRSFFAWFGDHSFPAGDRVAEVSPVLPVTPPSAPSNPLLTSPSPPPNPDHQGGALAQPAPVLPAGGGR